MLARIRWALCCPILLALVMVAGAQTADPPAAKNPSFKVTITGKGPPMILIPGLTCGADAWDGGVAHFKDRYECHVLTLAGFAGEPSIAAPMLETVRKDLAAYIREKKLAKPVIVGHSLGGFLAFWLAAEEPALVGPVVAVEGAPFVTGLKMPAATAESAKPMADKMRESYAKQTHDEFVAGSQKALVAMITDPKEVERIGPTCAKSDPASVAQAMYEMMTTDLRDEVAKIKVPVLLVGSGAAANTPDLLKAVQDRYEGQLAKIPDHKVVVAEKARHFVQLDSPDFLFAQMDEFLAPKGK
jgi:N-formylmaleamate deformylase